MYGTYVTTLESAYRSNITLIIATFLVTKDFFKATLNVLGYLCDQAKAHHDYVKNNHKDCTKYHKF